MLATPSLNPIALGIFGSYFGVIVALFLFITRSLATVRSTGVATCALARARIWVFIALTLISFLHTWYYMFAFMKWSFDGYEASLSWGAASNLSLINRISNWTTDTALFEQAWAIVCASPMNWWWSEQLCLFTAGAWTIFVYSESRRYGIPYAWAYMLLGQLVAISVASNLFYLAVLLHAPLAASSSSSSNSTQARHSPVITVWFPILFSLRTIYQTPAASGTVHFLPNLLIMHALLIIPLVTKTTSFSPFSKWSSTKHLYAAILAVSFYIRARTVLPLISPTGRPFIPSIDDIKKLADSLIETLYSHGAQSSIGFDVVWTTISFLTWYLLEPHTKKNVLRRIPGTLFMLVACLVVSVGVVAPAHLVNAAASTEGSGVVEGKEVSSPNTRESKDEKRAAVSSSSGAQDFVDADNLGIVNEISSEL